MTSTPDEPSAPAHSLTGPELLGTESTGAALRHLGATLAALCLCFACTYGAQALQRYRPWVSGEGLPIVRMFVGAGGHAALPTFAEAGAATGGQPGGDDDDGLGDVSAAAAAAQPAEGEAQDGSPRGSQGPKAAPKVRIAPAEYEGMVQPIEQPAALSRFFKALSRTARARAGAITRVAHYGDSAVAADQITRTLRRRLQVRFGDAGHGYVLVSRGNMHYGHRDIRMRSSDGWEMHSLVRDTLRGGWYGYGGVLGRAQSGEYSRLSTMDDGPIGTHVGRIEVHYQRHRRGGKLWLSVDGGETTKVNTRAAEKQDAWEQVPVDSDASHSLSLRTRGKGRTHVYGVVFERDVPGVVYDSLGLVGARAERLLNADAAHMQRQIAHRSPDLLVLAFGGNEAGNKWLDTERYAGELREVVRTMRAGKKDMDCLLFGPLDQGEVDKRGQVVTMEKLPQIVDVQRRIAREEGCAFFDTYAAMGGENAVRAWYKRRPRLVTSDFRHATPKGYALIGKLYYKALLKAFADHLAAGG